MLLILSKSPFSTRFESFLNIACKATRKEKVGILHIQDACVAATLEEYCRTAVDNGVNLYVLKEDCQARGLLGKVNPSVNIVDYVDWVRLVMEEYERIIS
ncbi:MAG: sulfurtransferase complex subunit TusB [Candidatus Bathyarchaeota archaeon]